MKKPRQEIFATLLEIRRLLNNGEGKPSTSRKVADQIFSLLDSIENDLKSSVRTSSLPAKQNVSRRGTAVDRYVVQESPHGEVLVELRRGSSKPFRCSRNIYEVTANILAHSKKGLLFDDLWTEVSARMHDRPADYFLRICLRFWMSPPVSIVIRSKLKYRALRPNKFLRESKNAWQSHRERPDQEA